MARVSGPNRQACDRQRAVCALSHKRRRQWKRRLGPRAAGAEDAGPRYGKIRRLVGTLNWWSFCHEDMDAFGSRHGVLASLSRATETLSLFRGGDGMNLCAVWRNGQREEFFEPGTPVRGSQRNQKLWSLTWGCREGNSPIVSALHAISNYTGVSLNSAIIAGPLLTVCLPEADRMPDPLSQPSLPRLHGESPLGRGLGPIRPAGQDGTSL
ncbi:hypothetical protein SGPA1_41078 [Streptomyces misionensis JCM 4497]